MDTILPLLVTTLFLFFRVSIGTPLPYNETSEINNGTLAELVQRQTDTIKKIVSSHHQVDYPIISNYPVNDKQKVQEASTVEELKIKCQHLARLANKTASAPTRNESHKPGFYITIETTTAATTTTTTATTTTKPPPKLVQNVKYIKLEPVILQKTILGDGRTIYYWHKSLPSAVQLSPTTPPPTTTTSISSGYNFRNFFPSFYPIGGSESAGTTTTEKTATTPEKPEELLYQQQLKFVVPVPYAPPDEMELKKPWEFDQFAYYPKPLQPDTINLQVPYVPTFHVIKALAVPNDST